MKRSFIIIFILLLTLLHILNIVLLQVYDFSVLTIPIVVVSIIISFLFFIVYFKRNCIMVNQRKLCNRISHFYQSANKLLNISHMLLDNCYIAVKTSLKDNGNTDFNQAKLFLSEIFVGNSITKFLEKSSQKKDNIISIDDLNIKIDEYTELSDNLSSMIQTLEDEIKQEAFTRIEEIKKKYECNILANRLAVEYDCISEIVQALFHSIIHKIHDTSKPLSEEILVIKKNVKLFVQNIEKWKENLSSESSDRNFTRIINSYNKQNKDFELIFNNINEIYITVLKNLKKILNMVDKINDNSKNIQNIADRINVLSINASIESAKAGERGKGFRVISDEISKMSVDTKKFVKNIVNVIDETKSIAQNVSHEFDQSFKNIIQMLYIENREFDAFYKTLNDYYDDFNVIFNKVTSLIQEITCHVNKFNPIFQVHDISVQAMGNLNNIITKFLKENKGDVEKIQECSSKSNKKEIIQRLLEYIEKHITTVDEIQVVNKIAEEYMLDKKITTEKINGEIEIFSVNGK